MGKIIKEFHGHSGSSVFLMCDEERRYVLKKRNVERNFERLTSLKNIVDVPKIYKKENDVLEMEYIHGLDMKTYLKFHDTKEIMNFLFDTFAVFSMNSVDKDYTEVYNEALSWLNNCSIFPFTKEEFIEKLPKILPSSIYHGDMTLENIIYSTTGKFYFIDAVTLKYDSWIFDIAKMRQDLECKWFLRNDNIMLDAKLKNIQQRILEKYPLANDDNLLILMLLRVFLHCRKNTMEYKFIIDEVKRLWK